MLSALFAAIVAAPIYWLLVPRAARKDALSLVSLVALALYDVRLPLIVLAVIAVLYLCTRTIGSAERGKGRIVALLGFAGLGGLFLDNKLGAASGLEIALASQGGVAFLGVSYFVLKAASILVETHRRTVAPPSFLALARWLVFFPIFTSGPIEAFKHFDDQEPGIDLPRVLVGLERILFGCVRALLFSHYLAQWTAPIIQQPEAHSALVLIAAGFGASLRIYFDFAGYSDIAIGLSALYGYEIQENFDKPLIRRNIVLLWQHWHMTLTRWLRVYIFTPWTRSVMKRGRSWHTPAIVTGQLVTMIFCGLWHEVSPGFALWGALHGFAMVVAGLWARNLGRKLPAHVVAWWRANPFAHAFSVALTFCVFCAINILAVTDLETALRFYRHAIGM
jgi:alginate O-acetyltransferase complex protein AlgI